MKKLKVSKLMALILLAIVFVLPACSDDKDGRTIEETKIVGVKLNNELINATYDEKGSTIIVAKDGIDLSLMKVEILVINGSLANFANNQEYDCRKPMDIILNGNNGQKVTTKLRIQSAPVLTSLIIEGLTIPAENIFKSPGSIIVQVPDGTDLKVLKTTMEFSNGTIQGFVNGVEKDYTHAVPFTVLGVDEETVYPYELIITTEKVGPATIKSMTIGDVPTTKVEINDKNEVTAYFPHLIDFSNVNIKLTTGYGNVIDATFTGQGLNLLKGDSKVKIKGSNGITTEFTIAVPKLDVAPVIMKGYSEMGVGANDLSAVAFSKNYVLVSNWTIGAKTPAYYDFAGNKVGAMSAEGCENISYGFRKFATDADGVIIGSSLGMSAGEQWIYKWDNVTSNPVQYISFSKASLGISANPRAGSINVVGSIKGNAVITMMLAQTASVVVWNVTNGVVGKPKIVEFPTKFSYYGSVEPLANNGGFIVTAASADFNGIASMDNNFQQKFKITGITSTDNKVITYNNRVYISYVAFTNGKTNMMRVCDITDGAQSSYENPIMNMAMKEDAANGNNTLDSDMTVIDGQLYVTFVSSNSNFYMFKLTN